MSHHFSSYKAFYPNIPEQCVIFNLSRQINGCPYYLDYKRNIFTLGQTRRDNYLSPPSEQVPDYQSLQYGHFGVQSLARPPKRFLLKLINLIFTSWPIWSSPNPIFIGNLTGVPLCLNAILLMAHFSATFATMLTAVWYQI